MHGIVKRGKGRMEIRERKERRGVRRDTSDIDIFIIFNPIKGNLFLKKKLLLKYS